MCAPKVNVTFFLDGHHYSNNEGKNFTSIQITGMLQTFMTLTLQTKINYVSFTRFEGSVNYELINYPMV